MKQYVKLFEQFTTEKQLEFDFDRKPEETGTASPEDMDRELGMMGFPSTKTFTFESPIFIQLNYERWYEKTSSNYSIDDFVSMADDLGFDFRYEYQQYEDEEITEDEFFDAAWEEVKRANFTEPLQYSTVESDDFADDLIDDFNESKLENYCDVPGVETIRAKGITRAGMFSVDVVASADLDIEQIIDYLGGQYADGWGEGYEQHEHVLDNDLEYYVHTWRARDFEIKLINP